MMHMTRNGQRKFYQELQKASIWADKLSSDKRQLFMINGLAPIEARRIFLKLDIENLSIEQVKDILKKKAC